MKQKQYKAYLKSKYNLSETTYNRLRNNYRGIHGRCNNPKREGTYYGLEVSISLEDFLTLWVKDKGWKLKHPSIDRIDPTKGYINGNCRFIELSENCRLRKLDTTKLQPIYKRYKKDYGKPVNQLDKKGNFIQTFISTREAERQTNINHTHIGCVCNGNVRKTAGGYKWEYA